MTVNTESFANGWHNPYLYDGRDGVRYDTETGLYWMSVRAYDPTLGRFISQDPLGRAPLMGWTTQPYAYAGNNPLLNVDPSGQRFAEAAGARAQAAAMQYQRRAVARVHTRQGSPNCHNVTYSNYDGCYRTWNQARSQAVKAMGRVAFGFIIAGGFLDVIADIVLLVASESSTKTLEAIIDIAAVVVSLLAFVPLLTGNDQDWAPWGFIVSAFQYWAFIARSALALYHNLGPVVQGAVDAGAAVAKAGAGGIAGLLMKLVLWLAGAAVNNWLAAGGHFLMSIGLGIYSEWQREKNEDLFNWCTETAENRHACSSAPYVG